MLKKLQTLEARFKDLELRLAEPATMKDMNLYREIMQEHSYLSEIMEEYAIYRQAAQQIDEAKILIEQESDAEMREMAKEELHELEATREASEARLKILLVPKDPLDGKNIIMEIRAGTGGDEAALFAADLYRMYTHYAEENKWKTEILSLNETEIGGFKEIVFSVAGKYVYGNMRYESGVHRVQRVLPPNRGKDPYLGGHGGRTPRSRGDRYPDQDRRPQDRCLPLLGTRRTECQYH